MGDFRNNEWIQNNLVLNLILISTQLVRNVPFYTYMVVTINSDKIDRSNSGKPIFLEACVL